MVGDLDRGLGVLSLLMARVLAGSCVAWVLKAIFEMSLDFVDELKKRYLLKGVVRFEKRC